MTLRVGLGLFTCQVPPDAAHGVADEYEDLLGLARVAEELEFDSFWVSEHHGAADAYLPSLTVMLGALAAVTSKILLGTGVVLGPLQPPLRFAEDCAVVDQLARGRLILGLGSGWRRAEFEAFGIPPNERVRRTVELVQICRAAWTSERFTFRGRCFSYDDVAVTPRPHRPPPLLLGGSVPAAIERAGRLGDGFLGTGTPQVGLEAFARQVELFDQAARAAGRDPGGLPIGFHVNAWVSPDGQIPPSVLRSMWHQIGTYMAWHAIDDGQPASGLPPLDEARIRQRGWLGTPEAVVEAARPWIERLGDRELHVIFRLHYPGMRRLQAEAAMRLFAERVAPALRRLAGG